LAAGRKIIVRRGESGAHDLRKGKGEKKLFFDPPEGRKKKKKKKKKVGGSMEVIGSSYCMRTWKKVCKVATQKDSCQREADREKKGTNASVLIAASRPLVPGKRKRSRAGAPKGSRAKLGQKRLG